jgi:class 3 adenylate cyclase
LRAAQPQQVRKFVSVLFCDLTGSTALGHRTDPEALRVMMRRYYDNARAVSSITAERSRSSSGTP